MPLDTSWRRFSRWPGGELIFLTSLQMLQWCLRWECVCNDAIEGFCAMEDSEWAACGCICTFLSLCFMKMGKYGFQAERITAINCLSFAPLKASINWKFQRRCFEHTLLGKYDNVGKVESTKKVLPVSNCRSFQFFYVHTNFYAYKKDKTTCNSKRREYIFNQSLASWIYVRSIN
jgi:hypothetical protein